MSTTVAPTVERMAARTARQTVEPAVFPVSTTAVPTVERMAAPTVERMAAPTVGPMVAQTVARSADA